MIKINDNNHIREVALYGKCEQNGTPTPDNPVDIVCNNGVLKIDNQGNVYTDGAVETINVRGKNLFDKDIQPIVGYWQANGTWSTDPNYNSYQYIPVKPNTTYTASIDENIDYWSIALFNNDTFVERKLQQYSNDYTFTTGATTNKLSFGFRKDYSINTLQLEEGSTATSYEPYYNGGTATAEMLLKVGTYQDVQSIVDGAVTRNVGIKVFDGTENWYVYGSGAGYQTTVQDMLSSTNGIYFCTHTIAVRNITSRGIRFGVGNKVLYWCQINTMFTTLDIFKDWLADQYAAGTPVIVVYPLATPTTESVTPQPLSGSTVTQTAGSIDNMEFDVKRLFDLKKRYITDSNGVPHEVKKVYSGYELVHFLGDALL